MISKWKINNVRKAKDTDRKIDNSDFKKKTIATRNLSIYGFIRVT